MPMIPAARPAQLAPSQYDSGLLGPLISGSIGAVSTLGFREKSSLEIDDELEDEEEPDLRTEST